MIKTYTPKAVNFETLKTTSLIFFSSIFKLMFCPQNIYQNLITSAQLFENYKDSVRYRTATA